MARSTAILCDCDRPTLIFDTSINPPWLRSVSGGHVIQNDSFDVASGNQRAAGTIYGRPKVKKRDELNRLSFDLSLLTSKPERTGPVGFHHPSNIEGLPGIFCCRLCCGDTVRSFDRKHRHANNLHASSVFAAAVRYSR